MALSLSDIEKARAVQEGLPPEAALVLAKALRAIAKKLDADSGINTPTFELLLEGITITTNPDTLTYP